MISITAASITMLISLYFDRPNSVIIQDPSSPLVKLNGSQLNLIISKNSLVKNQETKTERRTITMNDFETKSIDNIKTTLTVGFNKVLGQDYAKLTISPPGEKSISLPVFNSGQYIEFNSDSTAQILTILNVNFEAKNIEVDVSNITVINSKEVKNIDDPECLKIGIISEENDCTKYEKILDGLKEAPLAYNRPDSMIRGEATEISLIIDPTKMQDPTIGLAKLEGNIVKNISKISRYMSAELSSIDFNIKPAGLQQKLVTSFSPTRWTWKVVPVVAGEGKLITLDVYAHIKQNNQISDPITVRTFRDRIKVDVKVWDQILDLVKDVQPIHTFVIAILGGLGTFYLWWKLRKDK